MRYKQISNVEINSGGWENFSEAFTTKNRLEEWENERVEISPDCMLEKSVKAIANELLKGSFVIGCDYKNKQLVLENVFHYTKSQRRMEIYTLFPDKHNEKRQLRLDAAFVMLGSRDILKDIMGILEVDLNNFDLFVIDKYENLYTEEVYDKYGGSMKLA